MTPDSWCSSTVEDCCEILDNRRVPLNENQRRDRKGSYPYWGANGVLDHIDDYIFDEPLLLIAEDGGHFTEAKEKPICQLAEGKFWVNNHAHVLKAKPGTEREWVYYWFVHRDITTYINGGTRGKLNQSELRQLPISLPPLPEQKKIAAILGSVDEAIQATQAVIDQTRKVKQGLLQQLLTRGIGHTRFKKTEIGEIPEEWEACTARELFVERQERSSDTVAFPLASLTIEHGLIAKPERYNREFLLRSKADNQYKVVHPGDFVLNPMNLRWGAVAVSRLSHPVTVSAYYNVITPVVSESYSEFFIELLQSPHMLDVYESVATGTLTEKKRVHLSAFFGILLPLPPAVEVSKISAVLRIADDAVHTMCENRDRLECIKKGLMQDLLTGRVRVKGVA